MAGLLREPVELGTVIVSPGDSICGAAPLDRIAKQAEQSPQHLALCIMRGILLLPRFSLLHGGSLADFMARVLGMAAEFVADALLSIAQGLHGGIGIG